MSQVDESPYDPEKDPPADASDASDPSDLAADGDNVIDGIEESEIIDES